MPFDSTTATKGVLWTINKEGGDVFILKFDMNGNFKLRIGGTLPRPASMSTEPPNNGGREEFTVDSLIACPIG